MIPLNKITEDTAKALLKERLCLMQSNDVIDLAEILYNQRNDLMGSDELERLFDVCRDVIRKRIYYLNTNYGMKVVNTSVSGQVAQYRLMGFTELKPKKAPKKVKLPLPTPSTFNPLIAQVFA